MSMDGNLRMVGDGTITALLTHPEAIISLLYPDADELSEVETGRPVWKFWEPKTRPRKTVTETAYDQQIFIEGSWQAIHFALTGTSDGGEFPANFLLVGTPVGDVDVGYGPALCFRSDQVVDIAAHLGCKSDEQVRKTIAAESFAAAELYPLYGAADAEFIDYVSQNFKDLKAFVAKAAEMRAGLLTYLN